jgi:protein involved in polysaccharide export with SLBB domain
MVLSPWEPTFAQSIRVRDEVTHSATTNFDDPFHGRYASYGVETTNSIRVLVAGNCVKRPGYYFVSKGSTLGDGIKAAGVKKRDYDVITIGRKGQTKGRYRMLHFGALQEAQKEVLRDGDEIEMRTHWE